LDARDGVERARRRLVLRDRGPRREHVADIALVRDPDDLLAVDAERGAERGHGRGGPDGAEARLQRDRTVLGRERLEPEPRLDAEPAAEVEVGLGEEVALRRVLGRAAGGAIERVV